MTPEQFYANEKRLAALCLLEKIDRVMATFDGSGDSGSIDEVELYQDGAPYMDDPRITVFMTPQPQFNQELRRWEHPPVQERTVPLRVFLTQHIYQALETTEVDWYNGGGGFGYWIWTPEEGVKFEVNRRIVETICDHFEERRLGQPEEGEVTG